MFRLLLLGALLGASTISCPRSASANEGIPAVFAECAKADLDEPSFLGRVVKSFRINTRGKDVMTSTDVKVRRDELTLLLSSANAMTFAYLDTDRNGALDSGEVRGAIRRKYERNPEPLDQGKLDLIELELVTVMSDDANGDGIVDGPERERGFLARLPGLLEKWDDATRFLVLAGDGSRATVAGVREAAHSVFERMDTDGDGIISHAEYEAVRQPSR